MSKIKNNRPETKKTHTERVYRNEVNDRLKFVATAETPDLFNKLETTPRD